MRIATFNINNVNRRLPSLLKWLKRSKPDIACLQELKSMDAAFPREAIEAAGYEAVWQGQKTWNGVAILSRIGTPIVTRTALPGDASDTQSRYIEAAVQGVLVASIYAPNGNPQPGPKFDYKLAWLERLRRHAATLRKSGAPVVLAGDFNVDTFGVRLCVAYQCLFDPLLQLFGREFRTRTDCDQVGHAANSR